MGYYINETSAGTPLGAKGKFESLVNDGATPIPEPTEWAENIVCVVDNGPFEAAAYAYSEPELSVFKAIDDRPKKWLIHPKAKELAK